MEIGAVAIERIQQMASLRQEEEVGSKKLNLEPSEVKGKIEIENLTVRYRQELEPTLQEFSASIPPSSRIGIVGRSGSGKSTLLSALCKMLEPQSGRILLDGIDISELSVQSLRSNMTIISQTPRKSSKAFFNVSFTEVVLIQHLPCFPLRSPSQHKCPIKSRPRRISRRPRTLGCNF